MTSEKKPVLTIIVASVRDGRKGRAVADWFIELAEKRGDFEIKVADLKEIDLPMMTEPNHPSQKNYTQDKTWVWSRFIESSDAFVFVMPEYNHSVNAPLANAIDYLFQEWQHKPAGIVSYGGVSGGNRAAQGLRTRLAAISIVDLPQTVSLASFSEKINEDGVFEPGESAAKSANGMLDAILKWHPALKTLRD